MVDLLEICLDLDPFWIPDLIESVVFVVDILRMSLDPPLVLIFRNVAIAVRGLVVVVSLNPFVVLSLCSVDSVLCHLVHRLLMHPCEVSFMVVLHLLELLVKPSPLGVPVLG